LVDIQTNDTTLLAEGRQLMGSQDFESAVQVFERMAADLGYAEVCFELGLCHLALGNHKKASEYLEVATRRHPHSAQIHANLGVALFNLDDVQEAARVLEKAVALDPEYVPALFNLGNLYLTLGRAEDSVPWLEKAISFDSAHKNTHVRLGEAYKILFNFARAADHYKLASAIDANDP
jgi:tetratricopeptide (TPR) repeat protein